MDQSNFDLRCEWGIEGVRTLAPASDWIIIVDVLSFSTAVDVVVSNGASVLPYPWRDESAYDFATRNGATLASPDRTDKSAFTLSPPSLRNIPAGLALVLPSPNGSRLSLATGTTPTVAACFRNYRAVADYVRRRAARIAVIPAGEQWPNGSLRPCFEDQAGAGAVLAELSGSLSPEAAAAVAMFEQFRSTIGTALRECSSGRELVERGFEEDVSIAAELAVSNSVPILVNGRFIRT